MTYIVAYFASGIEPTNLESWGMDKLILIDNSFSKTELSGKIWKVKADAIDAVDLLFESGIKLDVFISINEGLNEGGGHYPLNGQFFMGYLMQALKPNYIHIYSPKYYLNTSHKHLSNKLPNLPYDIKKLNNNELQFDLSLLNNSGGYTPKPFKMRRLKEDVSFSNLFSNIKFVRKSIWEDAEILNKIFMPENNMLKYLKHYFTKIITFNKGDFPFHILDNLNLKNEDVIGLMPWNSLNYQNDFLELNNWARIKKYL